MGKVIWSLEKVENENGQMHDTLVRANEDGEREEMGTVDDFIRLFEACSDRWTKYGWNIDKLIQCVRECDFE